MSLGHYLRRLRSLPPEVVAQKAVDRIGERAAFFCWRWRDARFSTYSVFPDPSSGPFFYSYFPGVSPGLLRPGARQIAALSELYLAHCFDLLGSGWVRVRHGMPCRGLEGHRYEMGGAVVADGEGRWLEGRINPNNLKAAQHVWKRVDPEYTPIDWHLDFKSGFRWAERTWYRDVRFGHRPGVDIKVPWELSRTQHLSCLAFAYVLAGAGAEGLRPPKRYVREFQDQVLDFIATNPPRFGANWWCTMDVGIRAANWLVAYDLFRAAGARFDPGFERVFRDGVYAHGRHIASNLEWFSGTRGNHYLADVVGLLFVAAYLPRTPETDVWLAFGVQELVREVEYQFLPDGTNFEASTCYHRLSAEMVAYATALVLGFSEEKRSALRAYDCRRHEGRPGLGPAPLPLYPLGGTGQETPFPGGYIERLERMAEFTVHATGPDGRVVQVGDHDSGRFLKLQPVYAALSAEEVRAVYGLQKGCEGFAGGPVYWLEDHLDHRHLVGAINGFFGREDLAACAGDARLETEIVRAISGRVGLPSYRGAGGSGGAGAVRVGPADGWERACAGVLSSGVCQALEVPVEGGGLRDGLRTFAYPDFGLYVFCSGRLYLTVRCGPIGQKGNGGHAHNDQLGLILWIDGESRVEDPGTYLYTPVPELRNAYRSVRAHCAPRVGDMEPGDLELGLFQLGDGMRARCLYFGPEGFVGRHEGFGAPVFRMVEVNDGGLRIVDGAPAGVPLAAPGVERTPAFSPGYGLRREQ